MSKYDRFGTFLAATKADEVRLTFGQIEAILGFPLPASKAYQAWWSNSPWNNVMTKVWLDKGFKSSQVDVEGETLVFVRDKSKPAERTSAPAYPRSPLFGMLKGTTIIPPGVDLTEPADADWAKVFDDDYAPPAALAVVEDTSMSVSDKIRELNDMGVSRAQIAKLLGKRYQHVRNVLVGDLRKAG